MAPPNVPRAAPDGTGNGSQDDRLGRQVEHREHNPRPGDAQALPLTVAEWPRNARETIRVRLDRFNGRHTVDVRCWWTDKNGELKPGRSGITISVRHLPQIAQAFADALRKHAAIDLALARGVSVRALARRYKVGADSLYRHQTNHLPPQLRAQLIAGPDLDIDLDRLRETESQSLLANLIALRGRLFSSLDVAEECGDGNMLARVAGQLHHNLEITGKLLGDLGTGPVSVTNVLIQPMYVEMRVELVRALRPFPDAARAVAAVLHTIEHKAADAVRADTRELAS
jgi:hypothetical protein